MMDIVRKRSISIAGHRTSISLETAFWEALQQLADREHCSVTSLVKEIDRDRETQNLSSAIRLYVLEKARAGLLSPKE